MKKLLLLLSIVLVACTNQNDITISGTLEGGEESIVYLQLLETSRVKDLDSIKLKNDGAFKFRISLDNPELLVLKNDKGEIINLLAAPGENIKVSSNYEKYSVYNIDGSEESEKIRNLVQHISSTRHQMDSISNAISNLTANDSEELNILRNAYKQTFVDQKRYNIRFIVENINSLSSVYALYQKLYEDLYVMNDASDLPYFNFVADSMKVYYPNSSLTLSLLDDIESRERIFEENKHIDELLSIAEETSILDISIPDTNGDTIKLTDIKEKVIMLIFWSSGDPNSTQALRTIQSTYNKYHDKGFEVVAVSLDNQKIPWVNSINYNEFDWINVSELSYPDSRTDRLYNITKLPTNFLIDREGDLVTKDLYGRNLEIWLDNLL